MKVKQLERELDRHKHGSQQMMQRNEQLVKEMEGIRQQGHTYGIQLENMRRELGDALVRSLLSFFLKLYNSSRGCKNGLTEVRNTVS